MRYFIPLILVSLIFSEVLLADCDSNKVKIGSVLYEPNGTIELKSDSALFNGFLIFEVHKQSDKDFYIGDSTFSTIEIFFLNDLTEFNFSSKRYYYNTTYLGSEINRGSESENLNKLAAFYQIFLKIRDYHPEKYFLLNEMTSAIFDTNGTKLFKLKENDRAYFIFKVKFYGANLRYKSMVFFPSREKYESYKYFSEMNFFLPVSKAFIFEPLNENILYKNGFTKSEWFPDYLYKKCMK